MMIINTVDLFEMLPVFEALRQRTMQCKIMMKPLGDDMKSYPRRPYGQPDPATETPRSECRLLRGEDVGEFHYCLRSLRALAKACR